MTNETCSFDTESAANTLDSIGSLVDFFTSLIQKIYRIVSGKWMEELMEEAVASLKKN